ncbi:metallophosphoesterase family protein [Thermosipho atlanticus]|uniref:3',5'-cyclic AMP phosphodiesterase CpdA n=1 Tax=Thermosipho atlanticus DSM 15807 TaxID=1123380 RepID=A0A1M5SQE8_9BACT|nr:metallophosphoesterase [Thermosipho atlanticus]SHH40725.1 3',5'-cyclic AMP phosphodiesterase CpdA [Thermosipho atlanticus DSM 15807]
MKKVVFLILIFLSLISFSSTVYMKIGQTIMIKNISENFEFTFPELSKNFIVAIYGDSRWGNKTHEKVVKKIMEFSPAVVVHLGDMVNKGDNLDDWNSFFKITKPLRQKAYFQPVKGNHENPDKYFRQYFGVYNYYSDFNDFRFIYIDLGQGLEAAINFLKEYATNKTIVFMHYPIFTVGAYCNNPFVKSLESLHGVFKSLGIKLVFSAHEHNYQRFFVEGINYVISGGGGAALYSKKCDSKFLVEFFKGYNFVILSIEKNVLKITAYDVSKNIIDRFDISY